MKPFAWPVHALLFVLAGCSPGNPDASDPGDVRAAVESFEGHIDLDGGRIWYRTVGVRNERIPLVLLHGGPGAGSRSLESFEKLGQDRLVVFYDQLGAGRSDHPQDSSLWTIERHVRELDVVRSELSLDTVHLLGHSWGSMLLIEYLLTQPEGVVSATFASPLFSTDIWIADARKRLQELPQDVQQTITAHEAAGTTDSPDYQNAVEVFYRRFLLRMDPWPEVMNQTLQEFGFDVYVHMWGPNEFTATGTLSNWNRLDALAGLSLPTLFTVGEFDETYPSTVRDYARRVPDSRFEVIAGAAHLTFLDAPEASIEVQRAFLRDVEAAR